MIPQIDQDQEQFEAECEALWWETMRQIDQALHTPLGIRLQVRELRRRAFADTAPRRTAIITTRAALNASHYGEALPENRRRSIFKARHPHYPSLTIQTDRLYVTSHDLAVLEGRLYSFSRVKSIKP